MPYPFLFICFQTPPIPSLVIPCHPFPHFSSFQSLPNSFSFLPISSLFIPFNPNTSLPLQYHQFPSFPCHPFSHVPLHPFPSLFLSILIPPYIFLSSHPIPFNPNPSSSIPCHPFFPSLLHTKSFKNYKPLFESCLHP